MLSQQLFASLYTGGTKSGGEFLLPLPRFTPRRLFQAPYHAISRHSTVLLIVLSRIRSWLLSQPAMRLCCCCSGIRGFWHIRARLAVEAVGGSPRDIYIYPLCGQWFIRTLHCQSLVCCLLTSLLLRVLRNGKKRGLATCARENRTRCYPSTDQTEGGKTRPHEERQTHTRTQRSSISSLR